jgi:hypothetical protein
MHVLKNPLFFSCLNPLVTNLSLLFSTDLSILNFFIETYLQPCEKSIKNQVLLEN